MKPENKVKRVKKQTARSKCEMGNVAGPLASAVVGRMLRIDSHRGPVSYSPVPFARRAKRSKLHFNTADEIGQAAQFISN